MAALPPTFQTHLLGARVEPLLSIASVDAAADLQSVWPRGKSLASRGVISGTELDHMSANKTVVAVQLGVELWRVPAISFQLL